MFNVDRFLNTNSPKASRWKSFPEFNFIGGHNDEELIPVKELEDVSKKIILENGKKLGKYNFTGPLGWLPLRKFITKKLNKGAKINCNEEEILIVSGSLQALDLVNETFLKHGDTVIVEEGCYGGSFSRFNKIGVNIETIPLENDGMDINILSKKLEKLESQNRLPRFIYTIPTIQNPTGTVMSEAKRLALIDLAIKFNLPIFEDDCYADLIWGEKRPPSIKSLDKTNRVIYCGSFSKCIAPGFRLGYLVADWSILSRVLPFKTDAGTGALEQMILAEFCERYFFDHLKNLNHKLEIKSKKMCESLDKYFGSSIEYKKPVGGIFVWIEFSKTVDTSKLYNIALKENIAINPGTEWSLDENNKHKIRLCFANPSNEMIEQGIKKLAEVCKKEFGTPINIANVS